MVIHQEQCIGCGACVKDCLRGLFHLEGGKAVFTPGGCIDCGHCAAVCPTGAVELQAGEKLIPYDEAGFTVPAENLLNLMRFRRSVRQFQARPVEQAKLAAALGLGACYIGFFGMAAALDPSLLGRLGLEEGEGLVTTLALGYPDVKYYRTVGRKPLQLTVL